MLQKKSCSYDFTSFHVSFSYDSTKNSHFGYLWKLLILVSLLLRKFLVSFQVQYFYSAISYHSNLLLPSVFVPVAAPERHHKLRSLYLNKFHFLRDTFPIKFQFALYRFDVVMHLFFWTDIKNTK